MFNYFGGPNIGWPMNMIPLVSINEAQGEKNHVYSLCSIGAPKEVNEVYSTRESAKRAMYSICEKYGMSINKVYDDKHDKTYFTDRGSEFHINRLY